MKKKSCRVLSWMIAVLMVICLVPLFPAANGDDVLTVTTHTRRINYTVGMADGSTQSHGYDYDGFTWSDGSVGACAQYQTAAPATGTLDIALSLFSFSFGNPYALVVYI